MTLSSDDRRGLIEQMIDLQEQIEHAATQPKLDPGRMMRLTALAASQSLIGVAALLSDTLPPSEKQRPPKDPRQLELPFSQGEPDDEGFAVSDLY